MLQNEIDWRHYLAVGGVVVALVFAGWWLWMRPSPLPRAEAPRGPQARLQDAPEAPPVALD